MIPSTVQSPELIELVERFTGQRRVTSVQDAQAILSRFQNELRYARADLREANYRRFRAFSRLIVARLWTFAVRLPIRLHVEPLVIVAIAAAAVGFISGIICVLVIHTSLLPAAFITILPAIALFASEQLLFRRPIGEMELLTERRRASLDSLTSGCHDARAAIREIQKRRGEAQQLYDGIVRAIEQPLIRLLNANISRMSGRDFERHLADIFRYRGCQVQSTGQAGDQGVDLIVWLGVGPRIAVQAKCYGGSVGNKAVQEVYTGMRIHRCQRCVVVTSSYFTDGAREAAAATGCMLIDGSQIARLIRGQLVV